MTIIQYRLNISMTDKELFEKTEKTFNLKKENVLIENIFDKGNFKKVLNEIRTSTDPAAASGGGLLGQIGSAVKYMSPTARRIRKAKAKKAEISAQQAQQNLMKGKNKSGKKPEMDQALKTVYAEPECKRVYDKSLKGDELTANDQTIYDTCTKKADEIRAGQAEKTGKSEAQKQIDSQAGDNRLKKLGKTAPTITKFLINPKNKATQDLFVRYTLQSPALGIPTESEIAQLAQNLTKTMQANVTEINNFKRFIRNEPNLQDDGAGLIKLLPSAPTKATKTKGTTKTITLNPKNVLEFIKKDSEKKGRSIADQMKEMVRQANKKYKTGNMVKGTGGGNFKIIDINNETGLITVRSANDNRRSYKFAKNLGEVTDRGGQQAEMDLPESFDQVIKRYR
jgi:hypothetical protein